MLAEAFDPAIPRLGVGSEPVVDLLERRGIEFVKSFAALAPDAHQTGVPERIEMLRHGLAGDRQVRREIRDRQAGPSSHPLQEEAARGIGDGGEHGFHVRNMQPAGCRCQPVPAAGRAGTMTAMRLTPWEEERLLIFTAAELARRHRAAGLALNAPEAIALICDAMLEEARAGASYTEVEAAGLSAVSPADVIPGVEALVDEVRLEVLMEDGVRLVVLIEPIGSVVDGPGAIRQAPDGGPATPERETRDLPVRNGSARVVRVSSHYPFERVNPRLELDRDAARGFRLDLPAGSSERWAPGETKTVRLVRYGGAGGEAER